MMLDLEWELGKSNPCHNKSDGRFCSTGSNARLGLDSDTKEWAEHWDAQNDDWGLSKLNKTLLSIGGIAVCSGDLSSGKPDPDAKLVQGKGTLQSTKAGYKVKMIDHGCHWNAAALLREGKVDSVGTGFVLTDDFQSRWLPHSWGIKNGKVVETTKANFGAKGYYGVVLKGPAAKSFAVSMYVNNPKMLNDARKVAQKWVP